jgi:hypothetical protein
LTRVFLPVSVFARLVQPLSRVDVSDAIALVVSRMPQIRQSKLRFKRGRPGAKFLRGFVRRHASVVRLGMARKEEAVRFQATNADVLTIHAAALEKLITENVIDAERFFNLDEFGATPGKDVSGQTKEKMVLYKVRCTGRCAHAQFRQL